MPRFPKNLDWTNATIVKTKEQTRNGIFIVTTTDITTPPLMTNWDFIIVPFLTRIISYPMPHQNADISSILLAFACPISGRDNHQTIEQLTGTRVYFAHAYSPHERGSNENRNRVLRRFIPKGQAIEELSDYQLVQINWYLNSRPLKCLNWHTPIEIFLLNLRH